MNVDVEHLLFKCTFLDVNCSNLVELKGSSVSNRAVMDEMVNGDEYMKDLVKVWNNYKNEHVYEVERKAGLRINLRRVIH